MSMRDDEFNKVEITNEEENFSFEFGSTPNDESASYVDNHDQIRDEVNDNPSANDENKSSKKEERRKKEQKESSNKSSNGSSSASSMTAAGAAVVAAVCVVTGIVSISAGPSSPEVSNVKLTPHETSVDCVFDIANENTDIKYKVELYNEEITDHFEKECQIGHNELEFSDLESSTEYTFEIFRGNPNNQNQEYSYESIYSEVVTTLEIPGPFTLSFDSNNREGTMNSIVFEPNSEYTLPVCIFVPFNDEYFGGWKVNGEGEKLQPGETIVVTNNTTLVAAWDKFPTEETSLTGNRNLFRYFPSQPSSEISVVEDLMDIDFNVQNVYFDSSTGNLNFTTDGGFVSTTRPFAGPISNIEITTSDAQNGDVDYTIVYSASPIYNKTTESGETQTIGTNSSYTFNCTNPDAKYFCLSVSSNDIEPSMTTITFTYNIPVIENEFNIYFDANGGSGSFGPYTLENTNNGQLPPISDVGFTPPEGYTFSGWKVKGLDDLLAPGTTIGISCDITLVAQWELE